jgi:ABC-type sugar transport system ATPase subunit
MSGPSAGITSRPARASVSACRPTGRPGTFHSDENDRDPQGHGASGRFDRGQPTDACRPEIGHLFRIIRELKAAGVTVLYITHYLDEVFQITDRLTVLRDGLRVATVPTASLSRGEVVRLMIGQEAGGAAPTPGSIRPRGPEAIRAEGLGRRRAVAGVSFTGYQGEILGITGALGSGKSELGRLLFGADRADAGRVFVAGKPVVLRSPRDAVRQGIGMLPRTASASADPGA